MPIFYIHVPEDRDKSAHLQALLNGLELNYEVQQIDVVAIETNDARIKPLLTDLATNICRAPQPAAPAPAKAKRKYTRRDEVGSLPETDPTPKKKPALGPGVQVIVDKDRPAGSTMFTDDGHGLRGRSV